MDDYSGIVFSESDLSEPTVVFKDYSGIWSELSHMYWSSSSSCLVSRHPLSSVDEIISHYCPHCLTRYMEDEANIYKSRCHSCFQCPLCECVLVLSATTIDPSSNKSPPSKLELACRYCGWKSTIEGDDKTDFDVAVMERERVNIALDTFKVVNDMHEKNLLRIDSKLPDQSPDLIKGTYLLYLLL